jgi:hypothetical protein
MGRLDEQRFETIVRDTCPRCRGTSLVIRTFLDRRVLLMLADPNDMISCTGCGHVVFESPDCPRCHAPDGLAKALHDTSRMSIPKRCTSCNELELLGLALVHAEAKHTAGSTPKPQPLAEWGEPGHHMVAFACESCDAAVVTQRCPLCDAPGPLRERP